MENTKKCSKCQSSDIILVPGRREPGGAGNQISVSRWNMFATVKPVLHVCGSCGKPSRLLHRRDIDCRSGKCAGSEKGEMRREHGLNTSRRPSQLVAVA